MLSTIFSYSDRYHRAILATPAPRSITGLIVSIAIAAGLWLYMFGFASTPFWPSMIVSTSILTLLSIALARRSILRECRIREIGIGIIATVVLYVIFYSGNLVVRHLFAHGGEAIGSIYTLKGHYPLWFLTLTLLFPIGPGEELFWRGMIQAELTRRLSPWPALILSTVIYAAVHIPSRNPVLLLAAFTGGLFWGVLFIWRRSIIAPIVSHALWDILVFVYFPFN